MADASKAGREIFAVVEGTDDRFAATVAKAAAKFLERNPGLDGTLAMTVIFVLLVDLMWALTQQASSLDRRSAEKAFLEAVRDIADQVVRGEHLIPDAIEPVTTGRVQ